MGTDKQHTVPQVYLRNFLRPRPGHRKPVLWVFDRRPLKWYSRSTRRVARRTDYYKTDLDELFKISEGAIAPILSRWTTTRGAIPRDDEVETMTLFLTLLHMRVERWVETMQVEGRAAVHTFCEMLMEEPDWEERSRKFCREHLGWTDEEKITAFLETYKDMDKHYRLRVHRDFAMWIALHGAARLCDYIPRMRWTIFTCHSSRFFITSDAPVVGFRLTAEGFPETGIRITEPNFEMTLPISPHHCLHLDWGRGSHRSCWADQHIIRDFNKRTALNAKDIIISSQRNERIEEIAKFFIEHTMSIDEEEKRELWRARWRKKGRPRRKMVKST